MRTTETEHVLLHLLIEGDLQFQEYLRSPWRSPLMIKLVLKWEENEAKFLQVFS